MFKKNNFFKGNSFNSPEYKKNIEKTKKVYNSLLLDIKENKIPLLQSYEKEYEFDFSKKIIKKFYK